MRFPYLESYYDGKDENKQYDTFDNESFSSII